MSFADLTEMLNWTTFASLICLMKISQQKDLRERVTSMPQDTRYYPDIYTHRLNCPMITNLSHSQLALSMIILALSKKQGHRHFGNITNSSTQIYICVC